MFKNLNTLFYIVNEDREIIIAVYNYLLLLILALRLNKGVLAFLIVKFELN